jgi:hypothetical protein
LAEDSGGVEEAMIEVFRRKIAGGTKAMTLLTNISNTMPKFLIYSRLDSTLLKCMLIRMTEIGD